MERAKCVFVGDSGVGKSCLLSTYVRKSFPGEYHPDFYSTYTVEVKTCDQAVQFNVCDTAGSGDYEQFRLLIYPETNVVVICFSISDPLSYCSVTQTWIPDVDMNCPKAPVLLVGTKSDLRDDKDVLQQLKEKGLSPITQQQGSALAKQIRACGYFECASKHQEGLEEIFQQAALVFLQRKKRKPSKKHCIIL
ncbi:unnamed protein product [Knipowitschia caucasica]